MRRGVLELCTLSLIADAGEIYPPDIKERLEASNLMVVEGTLYPLLTRLKSAGLLDYTWRESNVGPPRKYYFITPEGRVFLDGLLDSWNDLVKAVTLATQDSLNHE